MMFSQDRKPRWAKTSALLAAFVLAAAFLPAEEPDRTDLAVEALSRLQGVDLSQNPKLKEAVLKVLAKTQGTPNFVRLVQQFKLTDQGPGLLEVAARYPDNETGVAAMRLLLGQREFALLNGALHGTNASQAVNTAEALGNTHQKETKSLLLPLVTDPALDPSLRKRAVLSLAKTAEGAAALLGLAREDKLAESLKGTAGAELNRARWPEIRTAAAELLPLPRGQNAEPLPPLAELSRMKGDPAKGAKVFSSQAVACSSCHQVQGQGIDFGPNLSEIGGKLGKDALYESILDPSAGISFGYEAFQLQLRSGEEAFGLKVSETAGEIAIKAVGGIITKYQKSDVQQQEQMKLSIMPAGLQQAMTIQELVDLVEYLSSLRKSPGN